MRVARPIVLSEIVRRKLEQQSRGRSTPRRLWRWMKRRAGGRGNELPQAPRSFWALFGAFWLYFLRGLLAIRGQLQLILTPIGPQMSSRPI